MAAKQRYKAVTHTLLRKIFQNRLKPGDKLSTERELSKDMDVDRTSLRIALKQLESMQVLDIKQGDGIYVKNYLKNAGIDFLRMLFLYQDDDDEIVVDEYIIDEVWEYWIEFMPLMLKMAMKRISTRDIKMLMDLLNEELENIHDRKKIAELEVQQQDLIAEKTGNLLFLLISNSTRPMREKMVELFVGLIDEKILTDHIELKRTFIKNYMSGKIEDPMVLAEEHKKTLISHRYLVRELWETSSKDRSK